MPSQIKVDEIKNVAGQYKIKTDTLEGQSTTNNMTINSGNITVKGEGTATTNLQQGLAKAWAAAAIDAAMTNSFNLSTGTDHGTGDFSYPLINVYANANHVMAASTSSAGAGRMCTSNTARKTTSIIALEIETHSGATEDIAQEIIGNGDLA